MFPVYFPIVFSFTNAAIKKSRDRKEAQSPPKERPSPSKASQSQILEETPSPPSQKAPMEEQKTENKPKQTVNPFDVSQINEPNVFWGSRNRISVGNARKKREFWGTSVGVGSFSAKCTGCRNTMNASLTTVSLKRTDWPKTTLWLQGLSLKNFKYLE